MSRHINAVQTAEIISDKFKIDISDLVEVFADIPTADILLLCGSTWVEFYGDFSSAECDQCGNIYEVSPDDNPCEEFFTAFKQCYNFCPNCGTDMRGM